ncbi:hypothetical protein E2C01_034613 [Portunus trituberculatus]|uniref:Uncharacterized protein n=1 Tax=Portunus trituberculatus TaxID=210409 RepID=A0A5B7F7H7_PORTR|nr:hypothetical protein [Portunus trituberculatus]
MPNVLGCDVGVAGSGVAVATLVVGDARMCTGASKKSRLGATTNYRTSDVMHTLGFFDYTFEVA